MPAVTVVLHTSSLRDERIKHIPDGCAQAAAEDALSIIPNVVQVLFDLVRVDAVRKGLRADRDPAGLVATGNRCGARSVRGFLVGVDGAPSVAARARAGHLARAVDEVCPAEGGVGRVVYV